jgi:hypothetical protein
MSRMGLDCVPPRWQKPAGYRSRLLKTKSQTMIPIQLDRIMV